MILTLQSNPKQAFKKGDFLFSVATIRDLFYIVDNGEVKVTVEGNHVFTAGKGNVCGEQAAITGLKRIGTAKCITDPCVCQVMMGRELRLMDLDPDAKSSLRELCLRRDRLKK